MKKPLIRRNVRIYDIEWDTDGQEVALPSSVEAWVEHEDASAFDDHASVTEYLADLLSNEFDWCVADFEWEWEWGA